MRLFCLTVVVLFFTLAAFAYEATELDSMPRVAGGAGDGSLVHSGSPTVYSFAIGCAEGRGDFVHGERVLNLLRHSSESRKFCSFFERYSCSQRTFVETSLELTAGHCPDFEIVVSCAHGLRMHTVPTILFLAEYEDGAADYAYGDGGKRIVFVPLGLTYGLGYMKPLLDVDLSETKQSLWGRLSSQWRSLIYPDGYCDNTSLVLGYYAKKSEGAADSPWEKDTFPESALLAFTRSPFVAGKNVIFLVKGDRDRVDGLNAGLEGTSHKVVTTDEFIKDEDWHILSQLADALIGSGDSSCSDPFFFKN